MFRRLPFGYVSGVYPIGLDSNDPVTQAKGIAKRMGRILPPMDTNALASFACFVRRFLANVEPLSHIMSVEEWLETTDYNQTRKNELRNVWELIHHQPNNKLFKRISSFQKTEPYPEFKHARGINSRHDAFKVYSGPAFKSIERVIYELRDAQGRRYFAKHIPVAERAAAIMQLFQHGDQVMATDYSAFEASFRPEFMNVCECELYRHMLVNYPVLAQVICRTITGTNKGRMRCGVTFKLKGRRMSGDMCTSLGNGFSNLMIFAWLMDGRSWSGMVEGDDGIFCVHDRMPLPTASDYARLGFNIKIQVHERPETASFCGIIATNSGSIRDPSKVLQNFGWTHTQTHAPDSVLWELLRAKALSLAYESPNCPILRAVAERALTLTAGMKARFVDDGYHTVGICEEDIPASHITMDLRVLFARLFSISVTTQIEAEARISAATDLSFLASIVNFHSDTRTAARFAVQL